MNTKIWTVVSFKFEDHGREDPETICTGTDSAWYTEAEAMKRCDGLRDTGEEDEFHEVHETELRGGP